MKKTLTILAVYIVSTAGIAQNNEVQQFKDTINLLRTQLKTMDSCSFNHEKYVFSEAINNSTDVSFNNPWNFLDFKLISARGDRAGQSVTLELLVTNSSLNQKVYIQEFGAKAIDNLGKSGEVANRSVSIGSEGHNGVLHTNVPVRISITFNSIMPGTEKFNLVSFRMSSVNDSSRTSGKLNNLEIRNIPIEW